MTAIVFDKWGVPVARSASERAQHSRTPVQGVPGRTLVGERVIVTATLVDSTVRRTQTVAIFARCFERRGQHEPHDHQNCHYLACRPPSAQRRLGFRVNDSHPPSRPTAHTRFCIVYHNENHKCDHAENPACSGTPRCCRANGDECQHHAYPGQCDLETIPEPCPPRH